MRRETHVRDFSIGGVPFRIFSVCGPVHESYPPGYEPFLTPATAPPDGGDLRITLQTDAPPDLASVPCIFDSGDAWHAHAAGDVRLIPSRHRVTNTVAWCAEFSLQAFPEISVYCGEGFSPAPGEQIGATSPVSYPLDAVLLMYRLAAQRGVIVHGAGIATPRGAVLLPAVSGTGKSTAAAYFEERPDTVVLSDDRVVVRYIGGAPQAFGAPWLGVPRLSANRNAPLRALCFLRQADRHALTPIEPREAFERLLQTASIPWFDMPVADPILRTCEALTANLPCYVLDFARSPDLPDFLAESLT